MLPKVLITGATSGIGGALAGRYAGRAELLLAGRRPAGSVAHSLPRGARYVEADQAEPEIAAQRVAAAMAECDWRRLDLAILNAGLGRAGDLVMEQAAAIRETLDVNLAAAIALAQRLHAPLVAARGTLVFVGSTARRGAPAFASYAAAKAGLDGLARALAEEWRGQVAVKIIHPGPGGDRHAPQGRSRSRPDAARLCLARGDGPHDRTCCRRKAHTPVDHIPALSRRRGNAMAPVMPPRRALVTGGSAGLGQAFVAELLARGYDVVSVDRVPPAANDTSLSLLCDLADRQDVDRNLEAIVAGGPYEIVVFNAGVSATGRFESIPFAAYRSLLAVNAETPMLLAASLMRAGAVTAHMCFVSSLSHFTGYPGAAAYAASKDALAVYAKSVRRPFGRAGVRVCTAYPGPLMTEHAARHAPPGAEARRRVRPERAARLILDTALAGKAVAFSGPQSRAIAAAGRLFPGRLIRAMRRTIFDRLEHDVW